MNAVIFIDGTFSKAVEVFDFGPMPVRT
jgi:hypothetical protein